MPTTIIKVSYEPVMAYYEGCEIDGKLVETPMEAARFDVEQLNDGACTLDEFVDGRMTIEIEP